MGKKLNLIGQRFGRLKVVAEYGLDAKSVEPHCNYTRWLCVCDCGEQKVVQGSLMRSGNTRSCGCLLRESRMRNMAKKDRSKPPANRIHGRSWSPYNPVCNPTYTSWSGIVQMCTNPRHPNYHFYGARGITVCGRWLDSFENFLFDMGEKPEGSRLTRLDKGRGFEPDNCEWRLFKTRKGTKLIFAGAE